MSSILNTRIQIERQRIFIDHSAKAKTFVAEEFTMRALEDKVDNIFVIKDDFVPNLHIYDSDGEELPILRNDRTIALIESRIKITSGEEKVKLIDLWRKIKDKKIYVLWIKLPPIKKMAKDQIKIISLEYDAKKERKPTSKIVTKFERKELHTVFYIIRKPEDYDFTEKPLITIHEENKEPRTLHSWKNLSQDPVYVNETYNTISVTVKPQTIEDMVMTYSFSANKTIIAFPMIAVGLLSLASIILLSLDICSLFQSCTLTTSQNVKELVEKDFELGVGIIAAAIIIPGLIRNDNIRHSYKYWFLIPIGIALLSLFWST